MFEILIEREGNVEHLGWEETEEEAQEKILNYIRNTELLGKQIDFRIWIERED